MGPMSRDGLGRYNTTVWLLQKLTTKPRAFPGDLVLPPLAIYSTFVCSREQLHSICAVHCGRIVNNTLKIDHICTLDLDKDQMKKL